MREKTESQTPGTAVKMRVSVVLSLVPKKAVWGTAAALCYHGNEFCQACDHDGCQVELCRYCICICILLHFFTRIVRQSKTSLNTVNSLLSGSFLIKFSSLSAPTKTVFFRLIRLSVLLSLSELKEKRI